jgi:tripartite-type tricarboxylate transporter receptor subunit TctC
LLGKGGKINKKGEQNMCKESKIFGLLVMLLLLSGIVLSNAFTQEKFPTRPITFLIDFPAGGNVDTIYRPLLEAASKIFGEPIVPVNKPGASGTLAPASLKTVKPDGYTLSVGINNLLTVPQMEHAAFDPLKDFTYIIRLVDGQFGIVVRSDSPWNTLKDLLGYARQHPNEINYSVASARGHYRFVMEEIARKEGIKWNMVPCGGGAAAVTALLGGHVHAHTGDSSWAPYVLGGKFRLLVVFGDERMKKFPDVPTLKELGYTSWSWPLGIIGPAGMDKRVVKILHDAFKEAMNDPTFIKTIDMFYQPPLYLNSEDYDRYMRENYTKLGEAIRMIGLEKRK